MLASEMRAVRVDPGMKKFFSGRNASSMPKKGVEGKVGCVRGLYRLDRELSAK